MVKSSHYFYKIVHWFLSNQEAVTESKVSKIITVDSIWMDFEKNTTFDDKIPI